LKILLTNIKLDTPHGSEIWTWTIARELIRREHKVSVYSRKYGYMARKIKELGVTLLDPNPPTAKHYDIAIMNHSHVMRGEIEKLARPDKAVLMTHSIIQAVHGKLQPERPPLDWDCDKFKHVAISGEVAEYWSDRVAYPIETIPNPVASEYFQIKQLNDRTPKRILWGNHRWKPPGVLFRAAKDQGYELIGGFNRKDPDDIKKIVVKSRIICGTGRWIYEGMAAGRNCIVMNDKMILGHVTPNEYQAMQNYNMTLRNPTAKRAKQFRCEQALDNYEPKRGMDLRDVAENHLHVSKVVDRLLEV